MSHEQQCQLLLHLTTPFVSRAFSAEKALLRKALDRAAPAITNLVDDLRNQIASIDPADIKANFVHFLQRQLDPRTDIAISAEVQTEIVALLAAFQHDEPGSPLVDETWQHLGLQSIQIRDGGNGLSTVPVFMENFLGERQPTLPAPDLRRIAVVQRNDALDTLLRDYDVTGAPAFLGRSAVYSLADRPNEVLVVKYLRDRQSMRSLLQELLWLEATASSDMGLASTRPIPVADTHGRVVFFTNLHMPAPMRATLGESAALDTGADIDQWLARAGINFGREGGAIAFISPKDYYRYLDDAAISEQEFCTGLMRGIHDVFTLARHGVIHTVPITLFHNAQAGAKYRGTGDHGRYVLAPDIAFNFLHRSGMGRLDNWPKALQHGNIGVSGLRDFEELMTFDEVWAHLKDVAPEIQRLADRDNGPAIAEALLLGNALLAATLYVGNRMRIDDRARTSAVPLWQDEMALGRYASFLRDVFASAYAARRDVSFADAKAVMNRRAHWTRLARQLVFYMTAAYVPFVQPGASIEDFPTPLIYGDGTTLARASFRQYRPGTFHPARGFVGPDGDPDALSIGPVNGQFLVREFEQAFWGVFL